MGRKQRTAVTVSAIACITVLEAIALLQGIDGAYLSMVIAAISALAGFQVGRRT